MIGQELFSYTLWSILNIKSFLSGIVFLATWITLFQYSPVLSRVIPVVFGSINSRILNWALLAGAESECCIMWKSQTLGHIRKIFYSLFECMWVVERNGTYTRSHIFGKWRYKAFMFFIVLEKLLRERHALWGLSELSCRSHHMVWMPHSWAFSRKYGLTTVTSTWIESSESKYVHFVSAIA